MNKLAIGTANFGLNYGFKNTGGKLSQDVVNSLLDIAWTNKIHTIDTAMGYGDSESVLGTFLKDQPDKHFEIITKINKTDAPREHLYESLGRLKQDKVHGVLIHNFNYYETCPSLIDHLVKFKEDGKCKKIGISLYYPEELEQLIDKKVPIDLIQIAYSVFDQRFEYLFPKLKALGIEIHVRSVFLQGLYMSDTSGLSSHFNKVKDKIDTIQRMSKDSGIPVAALCLNFAALNDYISKIVVGVDNTDNLVSNINFLNQAKAVEPLIGSLKELSETDVNILFPHFWKLS